MKVFYKNPNFNYKKFAYTFNIKKMEFVHILNIIKLILSAFNVFPKKKRPVLIKRIRKRTKEVDNSKFIEMLYQVEDHQIRLQIPCIDEYGKLYTRGDTYTPQFQLLDKPAIILKKDKLFKFYSSICEIIISFKNYRVHIEESILYKPDLRLLLFHRYGVKELFRLFGVHVKFDFKAKKFISEISPSDFIFEWEEGVNETKKEIVEGFVKIFDPGYKWKTEIKKCEIKRLEDPKFWKRELVLGSNFRNNNKTIVNKILVYMESIPAIDRFTRMYMHNDNILDEIIYTINHFDIESDFKDIKNKRIRCIELYLIPFLTYLHKIYINYKLKSKFHKVTMRKDIRLNDIIMSNPFYQYDQYQTEYIGNSVSDVADNLKITQVSFKSKNKRQRELNFGGIGKNFFIGDRRNIHSSQYGHICPIVTPDRKKCGVVLTLAPGSQQPIEALYRNILDHYDELYIPELNEQEMAAEVENEE